MENNTYNVFTNVIKNLKKNKKVVDNSLAV